MKIDIPNYLLKDESRAWAKGYIQCLRDFGIWRDGVQHIGCLETPINNIIAQIAEDVGLQPDGRDK